MKKTIFWILTTIAYEVIIVGFGSYMLGSKIGESLPLKK